MNKTLSLILTVALMLLAGLIAAVARTPAAATHSVPSPSCRPAAPHRPALSGEHCVHLLPDAPSPFTPGILTEWERFKSFC